MRGVLVTGGSGMVGSELKRIMPDAMYPSSKELNLLDQLSIEQYFSNHRVTYVIHLAAYVGSLHDNIRNRIDYFDKNVLMNTMLTRAAFEHGVENFLGVLSTCIYPDPVSSFPIAENMLHEGKPHESLLSYSYAKRSHAIQLDNYKFSHGVNFSYVIPCNLYGSPNLKHLDRQHFINDLIYKICKAERTNGIVTLFGDGTPLRQFMHARDLAKVLFRYVVENLSDCFNVAPSENISVHEYAMTVKNALNLHHLEVVYDNTLPNGQFRKDVCNNKLLEAFPDFEFTPLEEGIHEIYQIYRNLK